MNTAMRSSKSIIKQILFRQLRQHLEIPFIGIVIVRQLDLTATYGCHPNLSIQPRLKPTSDVSIRDLAKSLNSHRPPPPVCPSV